MKNIFLLSIITIYAVSCTNKDQRSVDNQSMNEVSTQTDLDEKDFLSKGKEIAMASQKALGGQLMAKMKEGGPIHALEFCSVKAIPITDSLSEAQHVKIRRVSDKNRNSGNIANKSQLDYMELVKLQLKNGDIPQPYLETEGENPQGYYPIVTNPTCLQCHGTPNDQISSATFTKINELYPNDKAIGYDNNELRGIWVIEMMK